ncbi:MAG: hypothetical protein BSOLF_0949 [Candidatus Carbobacillus altaicus]|uniref:Uncharacterized protein n=1 Tax=Candidatus Carbonibacillus altaicus TaxID=2163959 RepID=A0A2R6Y514_9BACL|nr:MAG: hypothetical protein BSOLF_0949 [Candidatus Carbobacillus altaicus]
MWKKIQDWLIQSRKNIKTIMLPIIILYFIRTMFIPTFIDVFVLFILFLIYVGALLEWY